MSEFLARVGRRVERIRSRVIRGVFGDELGVLLFLGALVFFGLYWRVDVFITDSTSLVNGLGAVWRGTPFVGDPVLGPSLNSP